MQRWSDEETQALKTMRELMKDELAKVEQNVEVVGDRALLRFYRGHLGNMETACKYLGNYLNWRIENNIDQVRHDIVHGGKNSPKKFPHGEELTTLIPQTVCDWKTQTKLCSPLSILRTTFSPAAVFDSVEREDYIQFIHYTLEYQTLVLEQLAEKKEREALQKAKDAGETLTEPYGVILQACTIRDLTGLSLEHIGPRGSEITRTVVAISQDNYPELLSKLYIVNAPWIFNAFWWALKAVLPTRTVAKVSLLGTSYQTELHKDIDPCYLPPYLGGTYEEDPYEPFEFDTTEGGLLHCPPEVRMK